MVSSTPASPPPAAGATAEAPALDVDNTPLDGTSASGHRDSTSSPSPARRDGGPRHLLDRLVGRLDRVPARTIDHITMAGIAAFVLAAYLESLLRGIGYHGDTAKFQMLGAVGGVPHATGYPLYVALLQAFNDVVPVGSPAWKANLLSAVCSTGAIVLLFQLLRLLDVRRTVAAATALTFAFTVTFWEQSVVAEVYALHILFTLAVTICLVKWRMGAANAWLLAGLGLYAISFGHHLSSSLALPAVAWLVLSDRRRAITLRNVAFVAVAVVVGASQYLYLFRMDAVGGHSEFHVKTFDQFYNFVTGGSFKNAMFAFTFRQFVENRLPLIYDFTFRQYGWLLVPAAYGIVRALRRPLPVERAVAIHLLLLGTTTAVYAANYNVIDVIVFCLPLFLVLAVFLGIGLEGIVAWLRARRPGSLTLAVALVAVVAAIPLATGKAHHLEASQRYNTQAREKIERTLDAAGSHAMILTDGYHDSEYFWYYTLAEGIRSERDIWVTAFAKPEAVRNHFRGLGGPVTHNVSLMDEPDQVRFFTSSRQQAIALRRMDLRVIPVAPSVWEVQAPEPGPHGRRL